MTFEAKFKVKHMAYKKWHHDCQVFLKVHFYFNKNITNHKKLPGNGNCEDSNLYAETMEP